jgi:cyclopropane fatty-acyl-phospholipid synthase-like methyltransferase
MQTIYEHGTYSENNPTWHQEDSPWKANHIRKILQENDIAAAAICEIGCGVGDVLLNLEKYFPESSLSGYEIAPYAYERAKSKETDRTRFFLGDITKEPTSRFDVALLIDVIEHVEDYISFLKNIREVGTFKVFHIPLDLSVQSVFRVKPIVGQRRGVGHIHYFFKETALATLTDCGYDIIDYKYTASRLELPNQALSSRLMRWPRRLIYSLSPDLAVRVVGGYSLLVLTKNSK